MKMPLTEVQYCYGLTFAFCFFNSGFFKAGNYVAAINAFTAAIVLDDSIPSYPLSSTLNYGRIKLTRDRLWQIWVNLFLGRRFLMTTYFN